MLKLLVSAFRRVVTAVTNPFRMLVVRIQRMFNINVITAKLVRPLTKKVKSLVSLRPQTRADYFVIGRWWVYKKLFLTILLALCAGVFLYFTMFAKKLPATAAVAAAVETDVYYDYDDMGLREFSGVANIRAADGAVVYTGDLDKGACTGNGSLWDRKGRLAYQGGFLQNQFSGKGTYYYPDGKIKYEGDWESNLYHGDGILYAEDGETQLYSGQFAGGLYEGTGKAWSAAGVLLYEGAFSGGKYHGQGVGYYPDGTVQYKGEFWNGLPQGRGELYGETGKLLYSGDVYAGQINYRALVNYNFAEVREAFAEAPRVFYTDTDSAFLFEQAGVVVTMDCRVRVDTWEKPSEEQNNSDFYYLPGQYGAAGDSASEPEGGPDLTPDAAGVSLGAGLPAGTVRLMGWYGPDSGGGDGGSSAGDNFPGIITGSESSSYPESASSPQSSSPAPYPDFVEKNQTLYFEIDRDVWQAEDALDAEKVRVKKVTVFAGTLPEPPGGGMEFDDNLPAGLEDCVAIDLLRQRIPTAFSQIRFESDRQNRLFVRLWNLDFSSKLDRRSYMAGELTYRYAYSGADGEAPLYFSVER